MDSRADSDNDEWYTHRVPPAACLYNVTYSLVVTTTSTTYPMHTANIMLRLHQGTAGARWDNGRKAGWWAEGGISIGGIWYRQIWSRDISAVRGKVRYPLSALCNQKIFLSKLSETYSETLRCLLGTGKQPQTLQIHRLYDPIKPL